MFWFSFLLTQLTQALEVSIPDPLATLVASDLAPTVLAQAVAPTSSIPFASPRSLMNTTPEPVFSSPPAIEARRESARLQIDQAISSANETWTRRLHDPSSPSPVSPQLETVISVILAPDLIHD